MPMSSYLHLEKITDLMVKTDPKTLLDVGVGFGKWGCLAREYLEGWVHHRYLKEQWQTTVHGIEIYEPYRNPLWGAYDKIIIGDVDPLTKNPTWEVPRGGYDLTIMMDVFEHIPKEDGLRVLKQLCFMSKKIVFSFCNSNQHAVAGNEHESHVSKWRIHEFDSFMPKILAECPYKSWGILVIG